MISAIDLSQILTYGIFGNPILTAEQTRVAMTYIADVQHIHLANINGACAGIKEYYGRPIEFSGGWRPLCASNPATTRRTWPCPGSTIFKSEDLSTVNNTVYGRVSVAEAKAMYDVLAAICPAFTTNQCPHTPPLRLPAPVCDDVGSLLIANGVAQSIAEVEGLGSLISFAVSGCSLYLKLTTSFDDTFIGFAWAGRGVRV